MLAIRRRSLIRHQRLLGDVEAGHDDRAFGPKDDVGCLGVVEDVRLSRWGCVPTDERGAPHQHDLGDLLREPRLEQHRQGDVGEGAERDQCDLTW